MARKYNYHIPNDLIPRFCENCRKPYYPKPHIYKAAWLRRRFCSAACSRIILSVERTRILPRPCEWCGKEFKPRDAVSPNRFCSRKCYGQSKVGISILPRRGRRVPFLCPVCHSTKMMPESTARIRKFCSRDCYRVWCASSGNRFSNALPFYLSQEWRQLRLYIKMRDGFECAKCKSPKSLVVHHINHRNNFKDATAKLHPVADDETNLITLCASCHQLEHVP